MQECTGTIIFTIPVLNINNLYLIPPNYIWYLTYPPIGEWCEHKVQMPNDN